MLDGWFGIAVVTNNITLFNSAVTALNQAIPVYFYNFAADGSNPKTSPLISSKWNGQTIFDAATSGVTEETCRDLQHTQFGLAGAFNSLETAYIQGTDLYSPFMSRMTTAMELNAGLFPAGFNNMKSGGTKVSSPTDICGGSVSAVLNPPFEVAYNAYHNRMGIPLPNTLAYLVGSVRNITYQENASSENHGMCFETLHHGGAPSGVIPTPTPTGQACQISLQ
jgi:hypothetical protein